LSHIEIAKLFEKNAKQPPNSKNPLASTHEKTILFTSISRIAGHRGRSVQ
jgi:hypothetical protein